MSLYELQAQHQRLSCNDESSENTLGQHGSSLQTRLIESKREHVITIYGKRTRRP